MNRISMLWKKYGFVMFFAFLILGLIDMRFAIGAIICMVAPIIIALIGKGRFWCGNVCPRGNFYDNVVKKFSKKRNVPKFLKSKYFRVAVIIFMFSVMGTGLYKNWGDLYAIGKVFYRLITLTTVVGIALSFVYNHRSWCNFCPMGSIAALIAYLKKENKNLKVDNTCVSCKLCSRKCPMGINPYEYKGKTIENVDCIKCNECAIACVKKSIK